MVVSLTNHSGTVKRPSVTLAADAWDKACIVVLHCVRWLHFVFSRVISSGGYMHSVLSRVICVKQVLCSINVDRTRNPVGETQAYVRGHKLLGEAQ